MKSEKESQRITEGYLRITADSQGRLQGEAFELLGIKSDPQNTHKRAARVHLHL